jgi:hypothetical protein
VSSNVYPREQVGGRRVIRVMLGISLLLHALFHASSGLVATAVSRPLWTIWFWTAVWAISSGALVTAAYGLWGWRPFARHWRILAVLGSALSAFLLLANWSWPGSIGIFIDAFVLAYARFADEPFTPERLDTKPRHGIAALTVRFVAAAFLAYGVAVVATRPLQQNWGATVAEVARVFPEDSPSDSRDNYLNHVITVNAPPEKVWPYLVQMGQDKAGFYSYSWLERAFGDHITNTYEVRAEWQDLKVGDTINLTQPDYFFGLLDEGVPLKVEKLIPNRLLQLKGWGTFWVEPLPGGRSRFGVHTSVGDEMPVWGAPVNVFVFEPAHWIMQQKMMRTIRDLAERP